MKDFLEQEIKKLKIQLQAYELLLDNIKNKQKENRTIEIGILVRKCPVCSATFYTLEQRKIYCSGACKTRSSRSKVNN